MNIVGKTVGIHKGCGGLVTIKAMAGTVIGICDTCMKQPEIDDIKEFDKEE